MMLKVWNLLCCMCLVSWAKGYSFGTNAMYHFCSVFGIVS